MEVVAWHELAEVCEYVVLTHRLEEPDDNVLDESVVEVENWGKPMGRQEMLGRHARRYRVCGRWWSMQQVDPGVLSGIICAIFEVVLHYTPYHDVVFEFEVMTSRLF